MCWHFFRDSEEVGRWDDAEDAHLLCVKVETCMHQKEALLRNLEVWVLSIETLRKTA